MTTKAPRSRRARSGKGSAPRSSSRPPPAKKPKNAPRPPWKNVAIAAGVMLVVVGAMTFWMRRIGGGGSGAAVEFSLPEGASASEIADQLASLGVVRSPSAFATYLRLFGDVAKLKPGRHLLTDDLSAGEIVAMLERVPGGRKTKVTFPEGFTKFDVAKRLADKHVVSYGWFLEATNDKALLRELAIPAESAEGYLFPATYVFPLDAEPADVIRRMKSEFDHRVEKLGEAHPDLPGALAKEVGFSFHDVVTLASLVEKEAAVDDERPLVASAFYNRFRDPTFTPKPPKLQSDPTAGYGCLAMREKIPSCAAYAGKITPEINADPQNPYSTYSHAGLPPGPIANPGEKSLLAAIAPADTPYLYFVAKGGGRHTFSASIADHNAAVKRLRDARHGP